MQSQVHASSNEPGFSANTVVARILQENDLTVPLTGRQHILVEHRASRDACHMQSKMIESEKPGSLAWVCCKGDVGGPSMGRGQAGGWQTFGSPCHLGDVLETGQVRMGLFISKSVLPGMECCIPSHSMPVIQNLWSQVAHMKSCLLCGINPMFVLM